jgi:hypothetical protein
MVANQRPLPSWSWLGWQGETNHIEHDKEPQYHVRKADIKLLYPDGMLFSKEHRFQAQSEKTLHEFSQPLAIKFNAKMVDMDDFALEKSPKGRYAILVCGNYVTWFFSHAIAVNMHELYAELQDGSIGLMLVTECSGRPGVEQWHFLVLSSMLNKALPELDWQWPAVADSMIRIPVLPLPTSRREIILT